MSEDSLSFSNKNKFNKEDYYISDDGYIVFTEKYHLKRGFCCQSGCKHCPYGFDKKQGRITSKKN